ncbi:uncharacterized protein LOC144429827 [Styela clava]
MWNRYMAITLIYQALGKRENWEESSYPRIGELEKVLGANKYFGGVEDGSADYMIYPWLRLFGPHGIDNVLSAGKFPKLGQWLKEVAQDETIKKCGTKPEIISKFLNGYTTGNYVFFPKKTKGTLRLYSMQYCPYAMRARLMLAKKNVEHEVINILLRNKPTWFLEKYPVGTVPVIEKDDRLLGGSLVIAEFIDEVYSKPGQRLLPTKKQG